MTSNIDKSWEPFLNNEFNSLYFKALENFLKDEYRNHTCFPPKEEIFNAFNHCDFNKIKVVIIGQDPYHGANQAHGLCFSVNEGIAHPPSLKNIFKELEQDLGVPYPKSGNLSKWADQGVFLLNATLTVRQGEAGSHQKKGWEQFTDAVIKIISEQKKQVVFLLWGGFAKKKAKLIDAKKHFILETGHPSPLSANRGFWFGNKHFSKSNSLLEQVGQLPVVW
ncbi:uracil-DNA glycosylase [Xanthomarina sp. F2636L]|uniref:uracil-DNA glycosylase n=1 Tax=Xanthomarina sp. F2636L TaxID=2996018 RepID=UPI00225E0109|nr:uracil-DNA glycosylase [Xanthomarina sp. F2636L]MCX7549694.1 uracil-DNA glycosylase [Xanthomarina sp. F2636L]